MRLALMATASTAAVLHAASGGFLSAQAPATAPAPRTVLALPPAPLLPATLAKLKRVAEGDSGDGLGHLDAEDAAVLNEDGIKRFARSEYTEDGKPAPEVRPRVDATQHGSVTVYQFSDASGAVAAFDFFRKLKVTRPSVKIGDEDGFDSHGALFRSGVNVVREDINRGGDVLMRELIARLPKVGGTAGMAPLLLTMLPGRSDSRALEVDSVRYALGPAGYQATGGVLPPAMVGFDKSAEVVTAQYKGGGVLTLLLYPTPQIAGDHGRAVEAEMKRESATAGTVKLRREGPLVLLTTGAWQPAEAQSLVDRVHLHNDLTWNKPMPLEFHAEVQKTYSLLTSIAIFCGVGALAAIVLGLFLGGGRALVRILQGKPAASEPEFLRIDLRGPAGKEFHGRPDA